MALIDASQLLVVRGTDGWSVAPRPGRNWRTPVKVDSIRRVYGGGDDVGADFEAAYASKHRFQATVNVINVRGFSGMDGLLQAMFDEVSTKEPFTFRWPQHMGTEHSGAALEVAVDGKVGDVEVQVKATRSQPRNPPVAGGLIQFGVHNGRRQLHRVGLVPTGQQTARFRVGVYPALTEAVPADTGIIVDTVAGQARFQTRPSLTINNGVVAEAVLVAREFIRNSR